MVTGLSLCWVGLAVLAAAPAAAGAPLSGSLTYGRDFGPQDRALRFGDFIVLEASLAYHAPAGEVQDGDGGTLLKIKFAGEEVLRPGAPLSIGAEPRMQVLVAKWGSPHYYEPLPEASLSGTVVVLAFAPKEHLSLQVSLRNQDGSVSFQGRIDAPLSNPWVKAANQTVDWEGYDARSGTKVGDLSAARLSGRWQVKQALRLDSSGDAKVVKEALAKTAVPPQLDFLGDGFTNAGSGSDLQRFQFEGNELVTARSKAEYREQAFVNALSADALVLTRKTMDWREQVTYTRQLTWPELITEGGALASRAGQTVALQGRYAATSRWSRFIGRAPVDSAYLEVGQVRVALPGAREKSELEYMEGKTVRLVGDLVSGPEGLRLEKVVLLVAVP